MNGIITTDAAAHAIIATETAKLLDSIERFEVSLSPVDAALAATYAQDAAVRVVYETHQFHGAIGLTLEYPLHYWTNRLRRLQGELGGASQQGSRAAQALWAA